MSYGYAEEPITHQDAGGRQRDDILVHSVLYVEYLQLLQLASCARANKAPHDDMILDRTIN